MLALYFIPFNKAFSKEELESSLIELFQIKRTDLIVQDEWINWDVIPENISVVATRMIRSEGFPVIIDIILCRSDLIPNEEEKIIAGLCNIIGCEALIEAKVTPHNPYIFFEIGRGGQKKLARVDPVKYDLGVIEILNYVDNPQ